MSSKFHELSITEMNDGLKSRDFSAVELSKWYLERIDEKNSDMNAFLEVFGDVLKEAGRADERLKEGTQSSLAGIPVAIKDNILIEGKSVSAGSKILENYKASYSATVVKKT